MQGAQGSQAACRGRRLAPVEPVPQPQFRHAVEEFAIRRGLHCQRAIGVAIHCGLPAGRSLGLAGHRPPVQGNLVCYFPRRRRTPGRMRTALAEMFGV